MLDAPQFNSNPTNIDSDNLCLGLVCIAEYGKLEQAVEQLRRFRGLTLGEAHGNRIPACVFTRRGQDKPLLAKLEELAGVAKVEVAYAHTLEEDEVR